MTSPDIVIGYHKLDTEFLDGRVQHTTYHSDASRGRRRVEVVETWYRHQELGRGSFGTVYLERSEQGECRAVKEIVKGTSPIDYKKELVAMAILARHDALFVRFFGWYESTYIVHIAMEYLSHGNLRRYLKLEMSENEAKFITRQLLEGLVIIHQEGFAHRDLKPENIFVVSKSPIWVKIGDFGVAKLARGGTAFRTQIFSVGYIAPEMGVASSVDSSEYTNAIDIWALGCITHEMLARLHPFPDVIALISYCARPEFPRNAMLSKNISKEGIELVERMLALLPDRRIAAKEALDSEWLRLEVERAAGLETQRLGGLGLPEEQTFPMSMRRNPTNTASYTSSSMRMAEGMRARVEPLKDKPLKDKPLKDKPSAESVSKKRAEFFSRDKTAHWVDQMKRFAQFVHNIPPSIDGHVAVKIAIIDGGVNIEHIAGTPHSIAGGMSFRNTPDSARRTHHFPTSFGHGTKMVDCVLQVFPKAKLYIARIETPRGKGQTQPTPSSTSAAEGIEWAVEQNVDIILMSWSIDENDESKEGLSKMNTALVRASKEEILLFCAAKDAGGPWRNNPGYPQNSKVPMFCVGGATSNGQKSEKVGHQPVDILCPESFPDSRPRSPDAEGLVGSSIATALAAGAAGLLLYCISLTKIIKGSDMHSRTSDAPSPECMELRRYRVMKVTLDSMMDPSGYLSASIFGIEDDLPSDEMKLGEIIDAIQFQKRKALQSQWDDTPEAGETRPP